jgi:hypothetical protein
MPFEVEFGTYERFLRQQKVEIDDEIRLATARAKMLDIEAGTRFRDALTKRMDVWRAKEDNRNHLIEKAKSCRAQAL